jgi:hypothetical protein
VAQPNILKSEQFMVISREQLSPAKYIADQRIGVNSDPGGSPAKLRLSIARAQSFLPILAATDFEIAQLLADAGMRFESAVTGCRGSGRTITPTRRAPD